MALRGRYQVEERVCAQGGPRKEVLLWTKGRAGEASE